jgi:hypothetical protein
LASKFRANDSGSLVHTEFPMSVRKTTAIFGVWRKFCDPKRRVIFVFFHSYRFYLHKRMSRKLIAR